MTKERHYEERGKRIRQKRRQAGLSQAQLAEIVGVTQGAIGHLENATRKDTAYLPQIAKALKTSIEWLETGEHPKGERTAEFSGFVSVWDENTPTSPDEVEVPFLKDVCLSAGDGAFPMDDYSGRTLRMSRHVLRGLGVCPENVVCVTASGNSMEPVIPDGCTVAIDLADKRIIDGKIYAINNEGMLQIKVLKQITGSQVVVESYNREYPNIECSTENIVVIGRVFWYSVIL